MLSTILTLTTVAVLIRVVANPLSNVFQKQLTRQSSDPLFVISATYGILTIAGLTLWPQLKSAELSDAFWQIIVVVGLFSGLGNVFLVKALQVGDLSVLGPVNAYKSVVGLLAGVLLLHEVPSWWGVVGMGLIVVGSYVVLDVKSPSETRRRSRFSWHAFQQPGVGLRLAALVLSAIDGAFLKKAIVLSTPMIAFFYWCLSGFGFTFVWILLTMRTRWHEQTRLLFTHKITYLALALAVGITQVASNVALAGMSVGYALALFLTSALLSVLFGYQFFKEQGIVRKLIGATIMVAGALLITMLG